MEALAADPAALSATGVAADSVRFVANGTQVAAVSRASVGGAAGTAGIRVNHNLDVHVDGFAVRPAGGASSGASRGTPSLAAFWAGTPQHTHAARVCVSTWRLRSGERRLRWTYGQCGHFQRFVAMEDIIADGGRTAGAFLRRHGMSSGDACGEGEGASDDEGEEYGEREGESGLAQMPARCEERAGRTSWDVALLAVSSSVGANPCSSGYRGDSRSVDAGHGRAARATGRECTEG